MFNPLRVAMGLFAIGVIANGHAIAQGTDSEWPTKPLRLLVAFAPGGSADRMARAIAPVLSVKLGQPVVVENRVGASGIVASETLINSKDEHTMFLNSSGGFSLRPHTTKLRYDPWKEITPVSLVCTVPTIFVGSPKLPAKDLRELVDYARKNPGKLNMAVIGLGTTNHLFGELLKRSANITSVNVTYPGLAPALTALMAGDVDIVNVDAVDTVVPLIEDNRIVPYAVTTQKRSPTLPSIPTATEMGFPEVVGGNTYAIYVSSSMPKNRVAKIRDAIHATVDDESVRQAFKAMRVIPAKSNTEELNNFLREEETRLLPIVKSLNLKLE